MLDRPWTRAALPAAGLAAGVLCACTAPTTILSSANPSRAPASGWADYQTLPVEIHGAAPGFSKSEIAALFPPYHPVQYASLGALPAAAARRHMVLYVNPATTPSPSRMCEGPAHFPRRRQQGQSAYVVGALCDGTRVISMASAEILTKDQTRAGLSYNFTIIRDQLYQSLFPGANDPDRYFEGY